MYIPAEEQWVHMARAVVEKNVVALHEAGKTIDEIVQAVSPMAFAGLVHPQNPLAGEVRATVARYEVLKGAKAKKGKG